MVHCTGICNSAYGKLLLLRYAAVQLVKVYGMQIATSHFNILPQKVSIITLSYNKITPIEVYVTQK